MDFISNNLWFWFSLPPAAVDWSHFFQSLDTQQAPKPNKRKGPHPRQRSSISTAISNGNFPCMGSGNRNHHRNLQVAVAVAVDQNFLIFGGRFGHQRRGPTLLLSENCDSTEKDWTDRSLRVWVDHQQQPQPRSGCTSRLRLKIAVVDGALNSWSSWLSGGIKSILLPILNQTRQ